MTKAITERIRKKIEQKNGLQGGEMNGYTIFPENEKR